MNRLTFTCLVVGLFGALLPASASAATFTTCIRYNFQTVDSGRVLNGGGSSYTEDNYPTGDNGVTTAAAMGAKVLFVENSSGQQTTRWMSPSSGCVTWTGNQTAHTLYVYSTSKDDGGNTIRVHTDHNDTTPPTYGFDYIWAVTNFVPVPQTQQTLYVGNNGIPETTIAMAGYVQKWYHPGLSGKQIEIGLDSTACGNNSAHNADYNHYITSGRHHISIGSYAGSCPYAAEQGSPNWVGGRRKFTVGHEVGHALAALRYGDFNEADGDEPFTGSAANSSYSGMGSSGGTCSSDYGEYTVNSTEWSQIAAREGIAHFVASAVFNDRASVGVFTWFNQPYSTEWYSYGGPSGGRFENVCCQGCSFPAGLNAGIASDWLRFYWDLYTDNNGSCCPDRLDKGLMLELYRWTRSEIYSNGASPNGDYYPNMLDISWILQLYGAAECVVDVASPAGCGTAKIVSKATGNGIQH